ncbi:MAG: hypothetical protein HOQ45_02455 [Nocardioidaceae bacterium]|nr:hypothetical protein [Dermatophilaceae bacterium]NUR05856.1 hypothetical protein [Nocardioidaceae bacterium]NUR80026.1 hypothetical protein [Dermatophilaceae bacterium]
MITTLLDLVAVACVGVFTWLIWEPLPLLVVALACLLASQRLTMRRHGR